MKRLAIIVALAVICWVVRDLSAATPDNQAACEKVLSEKLVIPQGVVYKKTTAEANRKAFDKLWQVFVLGDQKAAPDDLCANVLICGPGMWRNIKNDPEMEKLKKGVAKIKVPTNHGVQELEGKFFQSKDEVTAFWKAFWRKYKRDPQAKIRRPTARELNMYWAMIPYDITEPIFTIESKDATILAHFSDEKKMTLRWIDDYKDLRLNDESPSSTSPVGELSRAAKAEAPPSYDEARRAAWALTSELIKTLEQGDMTHWPGTRDWLKDFREQSKGINKALPVKQWPKMDIGAIMDHNPNFWRMYYEIAPGDPMATLIHASLLLSQGEAMRADYILELGQHRPGIPKEVLQDLQALQATARAALNVTNANTEEGMRLFERGDYEGAVRKYRTALKLCPQNGWTSCQLACALRAQLRIARGEPPDKPGAVSAEANLRDSPEVIAAFAEARRHDPFLSMAYQGFRPDMLKAFRIMTERVAPAWKTLREKAITRDVEYYTLNELSEAFQEVGAYDLALLGRQLMAARRNSYDPDDYPILAASLRKLAPGEQIEKLLIRLRGEKGVEPLVMRPFITQESEDGQPAIGSRRRLYMPDKPPADTDAGKPVHMDDIGLLTDANDIAARTTVEDFAKFSKEFEKIADEVLGELKTSCKVLIQFKCTPSGHTVKIMHQPKEIDEKPLQEMYKAVAKMDKLPVKEGAVEFQIQISVTPKSNVPKRAE